MTIVPQLASSRAKTNSGLLITNSVLLYICFLNLGHKQEPANKECPFTIFFLVTVNKFHSEMYFRSYGII